MRELRPVRVTGQESTGPVRMVLTDDEGRTFTVAVDPRFLRLLARAGVTDATPVRVVEPAQQPNSSGRSSGGREGQRTMTQETTPHAGQLTPREIQSRIRAGQSAEELAELGGISLDRVNIFAAPVLAERAHVARGALTASVRRRSSDAISDIRTLGPAAAVRLREEDVDPESVDWDAWRREDGRWTLIARYRHDGDDREARFAFDQPGHFVVADDDEGRWLIGDGRFPTRADRERALRTPEAAARYDEELPLGDDALALVRETPREHPALPEPDEVAADADWIVADVIEFEPAQEESPRPAAIETIEVVEVVEVVEAVEVQAVEVRVSEPVEQNPPVESVESAESDAEPERPRRRNKRASIPSWDEIMFGGG